MFPDEGNLIEGHPNTLGPLATDEAFSNAKADITMKYITGEINSKESWKLLRNATAIIIKRSDRM